jgi:hypothetical protein
MRANLIYIASVALNNVIAFFFLSMIILGSYSVSPEAANPLSERQILIRLISYGLSVSLFFSLITLLLGFVFRKKMSFNWQYLKWLFVLQFFVLVLVYAVVCLFIYFK